MNPKKADGVQPFSYTWKRKGIGFAITPPTWSNPFWVSNLPDADRILISVLRIKKKVNENG